MRKWFDLWMWSISLTDLLPESTPQYPDIVTTSLFRHTCFTVFIFRSFEPGHKHDIKLQNVLQLGCTCVHRSCDAVLSKYLFFTLCWLYSPSYFLDLLPVCKYVYFNKFWKRKNVYEEKKHEGSLEKIHFQYYFPVWNSHKSPQHSNAKILHNYIANQRKNEKKHNNIIFLTYRRFSTNKSSNSEQHPLVWNRGGRAAIVSCEMPKNLRQLEKAHRLTPSHVPHHHRSCSPKLLLYRVNRWAVNKEFAII